jgi:DNA-binding winged helix-turn-helix (wHTH) protein
MGALGTSDIFLFERFRFDGRGLFRRAEDGGLVPLKIGSRAEEILRVLLERAGELVLKDEIIAKVWPGVTVEESNLTVQISMLRRSLDEKSAAASCIQTVPGRGYRFVAKVARGDSGDAQKQRVGAAAATIDCGSALRRSKRGSRPTIFRRRHYRGFDNRSVENPA